MQKPPLTDACVETMPDIPPLSDTARVLLNLAESDKSDPRVLALVTHRDPVYLARILAGANSGSYAHAGLVTDLDAAIRRLGTQQVYGILLSCALADGFPATPEFTRCKKPLLRYALSLAITAKRVTTWLDLSTEQKARIDLASIILPMGLLVGVLQTGAAGTRFTSDLVRALESDNWDFFHSGDFPQVGGYSCHLAEHWGLASSVTEVLADAVSTQPRTAEGQLLQLTGALVAHKRNPKMEAPTLQDLYRAAQANLTPPSPSLFADLAVLIP